MLELINVCKTFNPGTVNAKTALNDLNLTLNDGDFVTVIGGNGAGKSPLRARSRSTAARSSLTARTSPACRSISVPRFSAACFRIP